MLGTNWRVQLLSVAVVVEWVTGLGLIIVPRVVVWLLFGADIIALGHETGCRKDRPSLLRFQHVRFGSLADITAR